MWVTVAGLGEGGKEAPILVGILSCDEDLKDLTLEETLSQVVVKAQVECLLNRLHQVGPGSKAMVQRREWAAREDQLMKRERQAQWLRRAEGVFTLRKGAIKTA